MQSARRSTTKTVNTNKIMDKKNVEIVQLQKSEGPLEEGKGGKLETMKPDEAGGRALYQTVAQCSLCGFIGVITLDTQKYHYYTCANCGGTIKG